MEKEPKSKIEPKDITTPFQLLGAWLVGLTIVNGTFLTTATLIGAEFWTASFLITAAILNVPLFIGAIFLLQTRYRAELQSDKYYSIYLDKKTNKSVKISIDEALKKMNAKFNSEILELRIMINNNATGSQHSTVKKVWTGWRVAINDLLPNYAIIKKLLTENNVTINTIYGRSNDATQLDKKVISFSTDVDKGSVLFILQILHESHFDGYGYFDPVWEPEDEDIYIGSYGQDPNYYFEFNSTLIEILKDAKTTSTHLLHYELTNEKLVLN